jgi:hypothetical protein
VHPLADSSLHFSIYQTTGTELYLLKSLPRKTHPTAEMDL